MRFFLFPNSEGSGSVGQNVRWASPFEFSDINKGFDTSNNPKVENIEEKKKYNNGFYKTEITIERKTKFSFVKNEIENVSRA